MAFDPSAKYTIEDSAVLHLTDPVNDVKIYASEDESAPVTITVASTASKPYRQAVSAMQNRAMKRGNKKPSAEQQKEEGIDLLVACCLSSTNLEHNGDLVQTEAQFRDLLNDNSVSWIKQQVDAFLSSIENFIKK